MDITLIIYIVFAIVVLYVLLSYLAEVFLSESSYFQEKKKEQLIINDSNFKYDLYKRSAIIDAYSNDIIDTNVKYNDIIINIIDINNKIECDTFIIGENINIINNLNLKANKVISNSKYYTVLDDCIFDVNNNLYIIYKDKNKDELKELASKYSVSKKALKYFTNAKYAQFALYKKLFEIRFSKPYYDLEDDLEAIVPNVINNKNVEAICINYSNVVDINIPKNVERIVIERKSCFNNLIIDEENKNFLIYNKSLLNIKTNTFVNDSFNTFNLIGCDNKKNINHIYKRLSKSYFKLNKLTLNYRIETNKEVASDLQ